MENNLQIELDTRKEKKIPVNYDHEKKPSNIEKPKKKRISFKITNNIIAFVILCLCVLMQNIIIGGANNAILTTIERAYYMTSIESAIFLTLYDCANIG